MAVTVGFTRVNGSRRREVVIETDEKTVTVGQVLAAAGVELGKGDQILLNTRVVGLGERVESGQEIVLSPEIAGGG